MEREGDEGKVGERESERVERREERRKGGVSLGRPRNGQR